MKYTDEHLNYWGEIYCRANLIEYDLPFALFVRDPWKWLVKLGVNDPEMPTIGMSREPVLPADSHAQRRTRYGAGPVVIELAKYRERAAG